MIGRLPPYVPLCCAIAFVAAALADPLVEAAANAGLFGPGTFTDRSNADVIPVLAAGSLFVGFHLLGRLRRFLAISSLEANWSRTARETLCISTLPRLFPLIFAMQIVILYAMETAEQYLVLGHGLGGTIWLGGPALLSLAIHAVFCALTALAISVGLQACANAVFRILRFARAIAMRPRHAAACRRSRPRLIVYRRLAPLACPIGERAPPFLAA